MVQTAGLFVGRFGGRQRARAWRPMNAHCIWIPSSGPVIEKGKIVSLNPGWTLVHNFALLFGS